MFVRFLIVGLVTCMGLDDPGRCLLGEGPPPRCVWCEGEAAPATPEAASITEPTPTPETVATTESAQSTEPVSTPEPAPAPEPAPMPEGPNAFVAETQPEAPAADPLPTAPVSADPDALFATVMTATVNEFRADLAAQAAPSAAEVLVQAPAEPTPAAPITEPPAALPEIAEPDLYPGLAYALNREAEGLAITETPALEPPAVAAAETAPTPAPVNQPAARLQSAVRLTGQALHAWLSVLQAPTVALEGDTTTVSR